MEIPFENPRGADLAPDGRLALVEPFRSRARLRRLLLGYPELGVVVAAELEG